MESIEFKADDVGIKLTAQFSEKGAEITSNNPNLFVINWNKPKISAYIKPTLDDGKVTLLVRSIEVGGEFASECKEFLSKCQGARLLTQDDLRSIPKEIESAATRLMTSREFQELISSSIQKTLDFGEFGQLKIISVRSASGKVALRYCLYHC